MYSFKEICYIVDFKMSKYFYLVDVFLLRDVILFIFIFGKLFCRFKNEEMGVISYFNKLFIFFFEC